MCAEGRPVETGYGIRVFEGEVVDAYLARRSTQRGYVVAIWRGRHVNDLIELSDDELAVYFSEVARVSRATQAHFRPRKVNYEVLGNQVPHLHTHITSRYAENDIAPGAPLPAARDRTLPLDELLDDVAALQALLAQPGDRSRS